MTIRSALTLGLSTLLLGGAIAGSAELVVAGTRDDAKLADNAAKKARSAIAKRQGVNAVTFAETAVRYNPDEASYRALLGDAYLAAGRFTSARAALTDALSLDPANGRVALNLALAQTATGDYAAARATLDAHAANISASDLGLAIALTGDPAGAVALLMAAARAPGADAKVRQNLALSLALGGRWPEARAVAAVDVAPGELDARMAEWAALASPHAAGDQIAALLGVQPAEDPGQPVALALNAAPQAVAAADPVEAYMPGQAPVAAVAAAADTTPPAAETAQVAAAPVSTAESVEAPPRPAFAAVTFAPRKEVVQPIPATASPSRPISSARPAVTTRTPAKGTFFVQLGAYSNAGVARDAWRRIAAHHTAIGGMTPSGMSFSMRGASFYRLSVGGFARADAVNMCRTVRARGGRCFVRAGAGDQIASWVRGPQLASR